MPRETIPMLGPSSRNSVLQVNAQKTVNMYMKREGAGAKSPFSLRHTPGLDQIDEGVAGIGRGNGVKFDGKLYFVIGTRLCSIDSSGAFNSNVATLLTATGRVDMVAGRTYLLIVDGTYGYAWSGSAFTSDIQATDSDFPDNPTHCEYLDGFFLVNEAGTDNFYKSASENAISWAALDFEVASAAPDDILALRAYDRDLLAFGEYTTQLYFNSGDADFPFAPYPNTVQVGILAPHSAVVTAFGIPFLGQTKDGDVAVLMLTGGNLSRISDSDIDDRIGQLTGKSGAYASAYTQNGHTFYCLTFPDDDLTLCCDLSNENLWHDRSSLVSGEERYWRVSGIGYISGDKLYAVDAFNSNISELSLTTYTEAGTAIQRDRYTQVIHNNGNRFTVHSREHVFRRGVANSDDTDPQIMMRISFDGGVTFTGYRHKDLGGVAEYRRRATYPRVGEFTDYVEHWRISAPIPVCKITDYAEISWGYS